jgi:Ran-interacting Mog1 protein
VEHDLDSLLAARVCPSPSLLFLQTKLTFPSYREKYPAYTLIATQTPRRSGSESTSSPDFTAIILTLLRLEKDSTDILITINVPHIKGEYNEEDVDLELGKQGKLIGDAVDFSARVWESFKIKDWNLFGEV